MALNDIQANVLMNGMAKECGLPITHKDPLQAFEAGLRSALGYLATRVTLDDQDATHSEPSEQPVGDDPSSN